MLTLVLRQENVARRHEVEAEDTTVGLTLALPNLNVVAWVAAQQAPTAVVAPQGVVRTIEPVEAYLASTSVVQFEIIVALN
jgi:hypothetical protein